MVEDSKSLSSTLLVLLQSLRIPVKLSELGVVQGPFLRCRGYCSSSAGSRSTCWDGRFLNNHSRSNESSVEDVRKVHDTEKGDHLIDPLLVVMSVEARVRCEFDIEGHGFACRHDVGFGFLGEHN